MKEITLFAQTDFRGQAKTFGIKKADRRRHMYILGKTGTGKSTLLKNLIIQDIRDGRGVAVIDPHGDLAEDLLNYIPSQRTNEVVYFNLADHGQPIGFNILEALDPHLKPLVASNIISIFKNIWPDFWGPRLEYILYHSVASLLDFQPSTLLGIPRLLEDSKYRSQVVKKIQDPFVKNFWLNEYEQYAANFRKEAIAPIQNKVGQFLSSPPIRNVLGHVKSKINMGFLMDNHRILICNLPKGKIGEDKTLLIGSLIITKIFLASLARVDQPEEKRKDFYLYLDECQHFTAGGVLASILSEARKYRLNLTLTNQYLGQLPEEIKKAILGNIGTLICFRIGAEDAQELEQEFLPDFNRQHLQNLEKYQIYLKLLIDGMSSRPFSARTLPPIENLHKHSRKEIVIQASRQRYSTPRKIIEAKINKWFTKNLEVPLP